MQIARSHATREARKLAEEVAERSANDYLQRESPDIIYAYKDIILDEILSGDDVNQMADAQNDQEGAGNETL